MSNMGITIALEGIGKLKKPERKSNVTSIEPCWKKAVITTQQIKARSVDKISKLIVLASLESMFFTNKVTDIAIIRRKPNWILFKTASMLNNNEAIK